MSKKLLKSTGLVSFMTMLSRILGFVRDVTLAAIFGAGGEFDAFVVAFKLPNFMRRLFGEGAFSQAFVPVLAERMEQGSPEEVRDFVNRIAGTLSVSVMFFVLLAEIFAPALIMIFAPGFLKDPIRFHHAEHMLRITSPYLLLISMVAFSGAVLNTCRKFAVPAFTPVLLNIALIGVAAFWAPHFQVPIYALAWGVLVGGVVQLLFQLPFLHKRGLLPVPLLGFKDPLVRRVMKLMVPALFGVSVAQISLLIDNFFASFLPAGSISWLYYSDRLTYLPLGVIGVALATVVLPNLSRHHAKQDYQLYSKTLDWSLRMALLVGVPAAVALVVLAGPLLATLIHHGAFNDYDVVMTKQSLMAFSVGLPAFMLIKILASAFYSRQNIKTPVKIAAMAVGVNLIFNVILISPLKHAGLALSSSIAAYFNAGFLLALLIKRGYYHVQNGWAKLLLQVIVAVVLMGVAADWMAGSLVSWLDWDIWQRIGHLCAVIAVGLLVYFVALVGCGLRLHHLRPPA